MCYCVCICFFRHFDMAFRKFPHFPSIKRNFKICHYYQHCQWCQFIQWSVSLDLLMLSKLVCLQIIMPNAKCQKFKLQILVCITIHELLIGLVHTSLNVLCIKLLKSSNSGEIRITPNKIYCRDAFYLIEFTLKNQIVSKGMIFEDISTKSYGWLIFLVLIESFVICGIYILSNRKSRNENTWTLIPATHRFCFYFSGLKNICKMN